MKRVLAIIMAIVLCFQFLSVGASAMETGISLSSVEGLPSEQVSVNVKITGNTGLAYLKLKISYDSSVLTLVKTENTGLLGGTYTTSKTTDVNPYVLQWMGAGNSVGDGIIATLTFEISETAEAGEQVISLMFEECYDEEFNDVVFAPTDGVVKVVMPSCPHTTKTEVPSKSADCVNSGNNLYFVCDSCGLAFKADGVTETTVEAEMIPALGHDLADATCEAPAVCRRDGCTYTEGSAKGHDWSEKLQDEAHLVPGSGADCQSVERYYYDCANCDTIGSETWESTVPGAHRLDEAWTSQNGEHYHKCTVDGCGYVADKAACSGGSATCEERAVCAVCGATYGELASHSLNEVPAKNADCEHSGNHQYFVCGFCGNMYKPDGVTETTVEAETIPAMGHTEVIDKAVAPTCAKTGLSEGKRCSVCGEVLVAQQTVAALGHIEVVDRAVAATCTATGLTEGKHCGRCSVVLTAQTIISALGHTEVADTAVVATCTESGLTEGKHCSVCETVLEAQQAVPAKGHDYQSVKVEATAETQGYTEHTCTVCGDSYRDNFINPTGHDIELKNAKEATCTEAGYTGDWICKDCGETVEQGSVIPAKGHEEVSDKEVPATCTEAGLTEGKHCSTCNDILISQEVLPAKGHNWGQWVEVVPPTAEANGQRKRMCAVCMESQTESISNNPFNDVPDDRFAPSILWAYYGGITTGKTTTDFLPDAICTREQAVTFLWRAAGSPEPASMENPFIDVPKDRFEKAILWAYHEGITTGKTATEFRPDDACTREQVVTFLWRAAGRPEPASVENPFADVPNDRFEKAILWAYQEGITMGKTYDTFQPDMVCTREQIVTFLYRYFMK